jgi:acetylglutamate kinase
MERRGRTELRIVVKIGGAALEDKAVLQQCAHSIVELARGGHQVAVVHGGGGVLTRTLKLLGKESEFINGLRVTDAETRDVALMVLAGMVNKQMVAAIGAAGIPAIGFCGGDGLAFRARKKAPNGHDLGFVGEIVSVESRWLEAIWQQGGIPVISSVALGTDGEYYNVNADQMASACAVACRANSLIFLTDVAGVKDADGLVIRWLNLKQVSILIENSVIAGGMLPKLEACGHALSHGVGRVRILPAAQGHMLSDFYSAKLDCGTEVLVA